MEVEFMTADTALPPLYAAAKALHAGSINSTARSCTPGCWI